MKCTCPKCDSEFDVRVVASMPEEQSFSMTLSPAPGMFLSAETVGKQIANLAQLFVSASKAYGSRCAVSIHRLETNEDGSIRAAFVITNVPEVVKPTDKPEGE